MKKKICSWETKVLNHLKAGEFTAELQQHLDHCSLCRETVSIYHWLNRFQAVSLSLTGNALSKKLPGAEFLWDKAFSVKKADKEQLKKSLRPLRLGQVLSYGVATIVLVFFIFFHLTEIRDFFHSSPVPDLVLASVSLLVQALFPAWIPLILGFLSVLIFLIITGVEPKGSY